MNSNNDVIILAFALVLFSAFTCCASTGLLPKLAPVLKALGW